MSKAIQAKNYKEDSDSDCDYPDPASNTKLTKSVKKGEVDPLKPLKGHNVCVGSSVSSNAVREAGGTISLSVSAILESRLDLKFIPPFPFSLRFVGVSFDDPLCYGPWARVGTVRSPDRRRTHF